MHRSDGRQSVGVLEGVSRRSFAAVAAATALLPAAARAQALLGYDWSYANANIIDPPIDVLLSDAAALRDWLSANGEVLIHPIASAPVPKHATASSGPWQALPGGYDLRQVHMRYAAGGMLHDTGALIARPHQIDPSKALIIALHGHEITHRGEPPARLWSDHWWPEALAQAGYVVITPAHLPYEQLASLYRAHDHHAVWTKFVWGIVTAALPSIPEHSGMFVAGLSSGGTTASLLMAWRPEISRGVFAGSLLPMEFLRQNYRIANHPESWNLRNVYAYLPYYLLCADRRVQWQLGRQDPFYPDHAAFRPGNGLAGSDRDVMTTEVLGDYLPVRDAAAKLGGVADLVIHPGGHEFLPPQALAFFANV
jgi:hypothetical protein